MAQRPTTQPALDVSEIIDARIPIEQIAPHPRNYKGHPYSQLTRICASLVRFGQVKSIVVQAGVDNVYLAAAGHGVLMAARMIVNGEYAAPEKRVEELRTLASRVIPAHWSPQEVEGYLVADNLISQGGEDDLVALAQILQEQKDAGLDLASLGTSDEELEAILEEAGNDFLGDDEDDTPLDEGEEDAGEDGVAPDGDVRIFPETEIVEHGVTYFRALGFPFRNLPIYISMQQINALANTEHDKLLRTTVGYQVADTYHPHRFMGMADGKKSPWESFHEDKQLKRTLELFLETDGKIPLDIISMLSLVAGTQACSNFRPGFALYLYREYCTVPGATVLDTSTGYGGRLVGFIASGMWRDGGRYIGIDPNTPTYEGNLRMARDFGLEDHVELYNLPAEEVSHEQVAQRCDFAFTSPPYFSKEHYAEDSTQSWVRYKTGDAWREGFLKPMLALQYAALKPGAIAIVNIADVTVKKKRYALADWTTEDGIAAGFEHLDTRQFHLQARFGRYMPEEVAYEPVIVFRKPALSLVPEYSKDQD